jgi:nitrite reductase (NO-forming)
MKAHLTFPAQACVAFLIAACSPPPAPPAQDPYDIAKMDLKPLPAKVSSERRTGAFAEGASLSMGAELKPLDPSPVKTIRLDTTHKIIEIAPGVKFSAWTFGDQVPGPTVRARVGDKIKFSMTNRSDEPVPGVRITAAPMMHSMDFHAAMVSPQDKYRSIAPGQTIEFEFTLNYPGIFMYHCGTPMILEHIASGMYGAVIVEPRNGYPTKVQREYVIVQSEFYAKPDPGKQQVDGGPLYVLDGDRLRASQPTHMVFNGRAQRHGEESTRREGGRARAPARAQCRSEQDIELPRGGHDLRSRLVRGQSGQSVPRHADRCCSARPIAQPSSS